MSDFILLGGFGDDEPKAEELALPPHPEFGPLARMRDAFDQGLVLRRGIVVVGPKGAGKTIAVRISLEQFGVAERKRNERDGRYIPRRVLHMRAIRGKTYRDGLVVLLGRVTGGAFSTSARGRRKTDDELREEFLHYCFGQNIVLLVFDEVEFAAPPFFDLMRDIMSESEDTDPKRLQADGIRASGIGVVLVGTPIIATWLARTQEAGQRWAGVVAIGDVKPEVAHQIYEHWFPGFAPHITSVGRKAWEQFIAKHVTSGRPVALRSLETHARRYFRRLVRKDLAITSREAAPFNDKVFLLALKESGWGRGNSDGGQNRVA